MIQSSNMQSYSNCPLTDKTFVLISQVLEEEFAREEREQQLFYAGNSTLFPIPSETMGKEESEAESGDNQVDGDKTPDNLSSKSSSGSTDLIS